MFLFLFLFLFLLPSPSLLLRPLSRLLRAKACDFDGAVACVLRQATTSWIARSSSGACVTTASRCQIASWTRFSRRSTATRTAASTLTSSCAAFGCVHVAWRLLFLCACASGVSFSSRARYRCPAVHSFACVLCLSSRLIDTSHRAKHSIACDITAAVSMASCRAT